MIGKHDLLETMLFECDICTHLFGKIPEGGFDYRPTPGQRSMRELLAYLSYCGIAFSRAMIENDWEPYKAAAEAAKDLAPEEFPAAMERQKADLRAAFAGITDADLDERRATVPWGRELPLGKALLDLPLRCLTGYRMQLFLYAKAAGATEISTANCWAGVDMPPPEARTD